MPKTVLVPEAHALGMLAAIRSLGRAGYRVHAASSQEGAIGFASRYCGIKAVCPGYGDPAYLDWLRDYTARHSIDAVVPGGGLLLAVEPCFEEFQALLPVAPERRVVYRALSKTAVVDAFSQAPPELGLLNNHPPSLVVDKERGPPTRQALTTLGPVLYLKADARQGIGGSDDLLVGPLEAAALGPALEDALGRYRQVLVQGGVTGRQAGVTLLMGAAGEVLARNCFLDCHARPTRSGTMSLRRTWHDAALVEDAVKRLRHLEWQGAAMLEYRVRDSDRSFDFIELNPRFWQSLHLDLLAGVDFPKLQMDWFAGRKATPPEALRAVVCGDFWPGEITRMLEIWRSGRFSKGARLRESLAFAARVLDLRIASDYTFPGDRGLYWRRVMQVCREWAGSLGRRLWH